MHEAPLQVRLGASLPLLAYIVLVHVLALLALILAARVQPLILVFSVAVAFSALTLASRHAWLHSPSAVTGFELGHDGRVTFRTRAGEVGTQPLRDDSFLHPFLIVLNLDGPWLRRRSIVVTPDRVGVAAFRRLYLRLRLIRHRGGAAARAPTGPP